MVGETPEDPPSDRELGVHECWSLLRAQAYGRLAVIDEIGPTIYPINALVDHGSLVFRTAAGSKLDALQNDHRVAFEVDGVDTDADEAWSVVIRGTARAVEDAHEGVDVVELGVTPWQRGPKAVFVRISPDSITGRRFARVARDEWHVPADTQPRPSPDE